MSAPDWQAEPWEDIDVKGTGLRIMNALLTMKERRLFYWLARDVYTGAGEIIDAGAYLGGSAKCFAAGLRDSQHAASSVGRIHSYDLFRNGPNVGRKFTDILAERFLVGGSFLSVLQDTLGVELENYVTIYPGDITARSWRDGDIEILMLDCCKVKRINDHCMSMFFPSLKPGSMVVQQDYGVHSRLHWIHSSMYLLRNYFEFSGAVSQGGSAVFTVTKPIPETAIEKAITTIQDHPDDALVKAAADHIRPQSERLAEAIVSTAQKFREKPF